MAGRFVVIGGGLVGVAVADPFDPSVMLPLSVLIRVVPAELGNRQASIDGWNADGEILFPRRLEGVRFIEFIESRNSGMGKVAILGPSHSGVNVSDLRS